MTPAESNEAVTLHADKQEDPFGPRYAVSEAGSVASAEDTEERMEELREQLPVYVDPSETDGLPTTKDAHAASEAQAKALAKAYTSGGLGFLKRRKAGKATADFKSGRGEGRSAEEGIAEPATPQLAASGGILAALIALNAPSDTPPGSADPSPGHTPGHSTPTTPGGSPRLTSPRDSDDSDDEVERERFFERRRAHRASKNALHVNSAAVAGVTKSAFSIAARTARPRSVDGGGDRPFRRSLSSSNLATTSYYRATSPSPTRNSTLQPSQRSQSQTTLSTHFGGGGGQLSPPLVSPTSPVHKSFSSSALSNLVASASRPSTPSPPPSPGLHRPRVVKPGANVAKQLRRLGGHLGLEVDTTATRPDAARSGAGVFGGLVMSTVCLARASPLSATALTLLFS